MGSRIVIRNETEADVGEIAAVTVAAFKTLEISRREGIGKALIQEGLLPGGAPGVLSEVRVHEHAGTGA